MNVKDLIKINRSALEQHLQKNNFRFYKQIFKLIAIQTDKILKELQA